MEGEGGDEVQGDNEVRLRHALDPRTRRWARAEFFCSALDRPWLADNGVQTLCNHFGLKVGQLGRLSRTDWTCIRRSLGRPRRLSLAFLRQVGPLSYTHLPLLLTASFPTKGWFTASVGWFCCVHLPLLCSLARLQSFPTRASFSAMHSWLSDRGQGNCSIVTSSSIPSFDLALRVFLWCLHLAHCKTLSELLGSSSCRCRSFACLGQVTSLWRRLCLNLHDYIHE